MIKAVLDTNVLVSATFWSGPSFQITIMAINKKIQLFTSLEILKEYEKVLERDFKQDQKQIKERINKVQLFTQIIKPKQKLKVVKKDPTDNKFIEAAIEAEADYIVSGDKHLLDLKNYKNIRILSPSEFMKLI